MQFYTFVAIYKPERDKKKKKKRKGVFKNAFYIHSNNRIT